MHVGFTELVFEMRHVHLRQKWHHLCFISDISFANLYAKNSTFAEIQAALEIVKRSYFAQLDGFLVLHCVHYISTLRIYTSRDPLNNKK